MEAQRLRSNNLLIIMRGINTMINSFFIKRSPGTPLTEPIEKGDRILSTRDNKSYTVTGFSQEYYIVKETPDSELSAVKRTDAIKLSPAMA